jgi:molecular chaperone DnaK
MSPTGAIVATSTPAEERDEIRFDLLEGGEKIATGLGEVLKVEPSQSMSIKFIAFGVDPRLTAKWAPLIEPVVQLRETEEPRSSKGPPPLPPSSRKPPALPIAREEPEYQAKPLKDEFHFIETVRSSLPPVRESRPAPETIEAEEVAPEIEPLQVRKTGVIIGIDLGTTNTCAAYVVDGQPRIIPGRTGMNTIPSMITFEPDGRWYVGQRAADRQILYPLRTVYGSKRLVGRTYRADLAAQLQQHFAYPLGEADGQRFGARINDRVISMDTIAARVLDEVRSTAEEYLKTRVEAAVITVPAYFTEVQRDAVRRAAKEANLIVHRIVNEPTAAAVAYGHKRQDERARVAVWDFGGGTFDFSIVDVNGGHLEVLATGGDNFVGGSDFDDALASHLLSEFIRIQNIEFDPDPQQIARLREAAEIAKRSLSIQTEVTVELQEFIRNPMRPLRVEVTRERFDELTASLVHRSVQIARKVMTEIGLTAADIDDVLLVGGTTRIPAVQKAVQEMFGRRPSKRINPDEAVAIGASLLADEIGSGQGPTLLDILPMTIGYGQTGLRFAQLVGRYSRLPTKCEVTFDADLLGNVTMPLFQGESSDISRNEYLCSVIVEDRSLWDNGRVTMTLSFDEHCVMMIDARNAKTGRALPARTDRTRAVEDILRELGRSEQRSPESQATRLPQTLLGKALGKLFRVFGH